MNVKQAIPVGNPHQGVINTRVRHTAYISLQPSGEGPVSSLLWGIGPAIKSIDSGQDLTNYTPLNVWNVVDYALSLGASIIGTVHQQLIWPQSWRIFLETCKRFIKAADRVGKCDVFLTQAIDFLL